MIITIAGLLILAAYLAYAWVAVGSAWRWHRARRPLEPHWTPPVTILKPVCGIDAEAYENFVSFCRQDYPIERVQLIFGALDPTDPALGYARRLQSEFPDHDIRIVVAPGNAYRGHNLKVSNLLAMLPYAKHDLLVLCDSDMRVKSDYLRRIVAPFSPTYGAPEDRFAYAVVREAIPSALNPVAYAPPAASRGSEEARTHPVRGARPSYPLASGQRRDGLSALPGEAESKKPVGLVTCPYRGYHPHSLPAILEALGIGADFIPSALVSRATEGVSFAFGSTIVLPRPVLQEIGGFASLTDQLADDFRLGDGARRAGYEVVLSDYVVDDLLGRERFGAMWARRLRWARTARSCRPAGYAGSFVTHGMALALLFLFATHFSRLGWRAFDLVLLVRLATAYVIARRFTYDNSVIRFLPLLPLSDLFSFVLFVASFFGNRIAWRGKRFRLLPDGRIEPISPAISHGTGAQKAETLPSPD